MVDVGTIDALEVAAQHAEALAHGGRSKEALERYTKLLQARMAHCLNAREQFGAADLVIMERVVDLATRCGYFDPADALLRSMVAFCKSAGHHYGADYLTVKRGQLALARGDLVTCRERLTDLEPRMGPLEHVGFAAPALTIWEQQIRWADDTVAGDRTVFLSDLYLVLGQLLCRHGQYGDALSAFERGLTHSGQDSPDRARRNTSLFHLAIASAYLEAGDTSGAHRSLERAEQEIDPIRDRGRRAEWLETCGRLAFLRGEFRLAVDQFRELAALCRGDGFDRAARVAWLNLAQVLILVNQTARAREILADLAADDALADDITPRAKFLLALAQARAQSLAEGVPIASTVVELWRGRKTRRGSATGPDDKSRNLDPLDLPQASNYLSFFEDRALAFQWALAARDLERARKILVGVQEIFEYTDSKLIHMRLGVLHALLAYYEGNFEQAESALSSLLPAFEARGLTPELWQVTRVLGWCMARLGRAPADCQVISERCAVLLEQISASLDASDRAIYLLNKWTTDEELLAGWIDRLTVDKLRAIQGTIWLRPFRRFALARAIARLCDHVDSYRIDVAERTLSPNAGRGPVRRGAGFLLRLLGHSLRKVTISFLVLPDRILVIRSGFLSLDFGVSPLTRLELREIVARWHKAAQRVSAARDLSPQQSESTRTNFESLRHELGQRVTGALQLDLLAHALPGRIRALRIIPDDSLHGVPFAALPLSNQCLAERFAIQIDFDSTPLRGSRSQRTVGQRLLVGVSRGVGTLPPLRGVPKEIERVSALLSQDGQVKALVDDDATRLSLMDNLPKAGLVHIACHGVFEPDRPDCSGFVLVPAPGRTESLSLRDLSGLDLSLIRHATLSSCWSADSFVLPGRHVISLPETFWHAGAGSVLGSLWPVDDRSAVAFMSRFYEFMKKHRRDDALRLTQLECAQGRLVDDGKAIGTSPYYWAGFVLYGEGGRLAI